MIPPQRYPPEEFLCLVWQQRLYATGRLLTTSGQEILVKHCGRRNRHAGPDFTEARLLMEGIEWVGNVEMHVRASDWKLHHHSENPVYNSVVLHVVYEADIEIKYHDGTPIPTLELWKTIDKSLLIRYEELVKTAAGLPCANFIGRVPALTLTNWLERMAIERLEQRTAAIGELLRETSGFWEAAFYYRVARALGSNVNGQPMEDLARRTPLLTLAKHKDQLQQIEALLFGQAGMLQESAKDDYTADLQREYRFLQGKYRLSPLPATVWRYARMRPPYFPTLRIAALAMLIHRSGQLFSKTMDADNTQAVKAMFNSGVSPYWQTHYRFGQPAAMHSGGISEASAELLLINVVIPFLFAYGKHQGKEELVEKALAWFNELPAEQNNITKAWKALGVKSSSAAQTQALLHLQQNYCEQKHCLQCAVGVWWLRQSSTP